MWFGTDNGLARFDGRRIQNLSPGGSESNGILALTAAPSGELWIGTRAGAFVYSENRFLPVSGTQEFGITKILPGDEVFLGTDAGIVLRAGKDQSGGWDATALFLETIHASDTSIVSVTGLIQRGGTLIASTSGRGLFDIADGSATESVIKSRMPRVHSAVLGENGTVWLGTEAAKGASGVYLVSGNEAPVRIPAPTADVFSLESNDSGLWAGTERYGLFHIASGKLRKNYTFENTSGGLRSNTIFAIFTDREGVVWIGTNRGVSRFDRLGASQETVSDIPNSNFVRALFRRSDGEVLAGTNRGLFVSDDESWRPVPGFDNKVIYAITDGGRARQLIGTSNGLMDTEGRTIAPGDDIRGFANFQSRTYAAVAGRGVMQVPSGGGSPPLITSEPLTLTASICEGNGRLWIGTLVGLFSYDGRTVKKEIEPETLKSGAIWKMFSSEDDALWIAGQHGVFRVRDGQAERIVEIEDVRDVFVEGDEFWAATTVRGLLHGRNDTRFGWVMSSVGFEQGLPSEKAFSIIPADNNFLIATNRGVVTYKPGTIPPKIIPTRMLSQRVHDLGELASSIALEYPQNSLLVEVAGQSSRTFPEEFQYAFVLTNGKGDEVARQLSNDPQYAPADLAPGDYNIEAIAFNRDLLASESLMIRFSIGKAPFPWTATALAGLLFLALVGLVWAVVEHRRIKQRNRELAAARLDLANEAERERRRIARDLHDQTLADLRTLMIKSDKLDPGRNAEFRNEIEAVSIEIRRICEDLSPSVLENVGLVAALEFLLDQTVEKRKFTADDGLEDRIDFPLNTQLQIYRIAQEVLTNIDRHSDADLVEMNIEGSPDGAFSMTIRDNGRSFKPDGSQKGRGISNIRSRANLINGRVSWKKSGQAGNVFWMTVGITPDDES